VIRSRKQIYLAFRCGRLANRLVIFANAIAWAHERGYRVVNYSFLSYANEFEGTTHNYACEFPRPVKKRWLDWIPPLAQLIRSTRLPFHVVRRIAQWNSKRPLVGAFGFTAVESGTPITRLDSVPFEASIREANRVFLFGWNFRAPELVVLHREIVREYLRPRADFRVAAEGCLAELRGSCDVVVGVHIRHGDYRTWLSGKYFFPVERYVMWMHDVVGLLPGQRVGFLVCSNEPRASTEFTESKFAFGPGSAVGDLHALSLCDYLIGPLSTYTQWASYYGNAPLRVLRCDERIESLDEFRVSDLSEIPQ
jgi:hypothetical protein